MTDIYWGNSPVRPAIEGGDGELVVRDGEVFYKISNYHMMPAFFMSIVSGFDHWMFVSSSGGLSCGRGNPESSLFPYYTDDKIHDAGSTTGPQTVFLVNKDAIGLFADSHRTAGAVLCRQRSRNRVPGSTSPGHSPGSSDR